MKIENFEKKEKKNVLEIWCIGSCPQNFAWIHSEKPELTGGRTDGRRTTDDEPLHHASSSADKVK